MSLAPFFEKLIIQVESSELITNAGTDDQGFYKPVRTILLRNLKLLKDLHEKPRARAMVKTAWTAVLKEVPPEWINPSEAEQAELKKILLG